MQTKPVIPTADTAFENANSEAPRQPTGHPLTGISKDKKLLHARVSALTHEQEAQGQHSHRTGRERPCCFTSTWREAGFVASIAMSQIFDEYLTSGFFALVPVLMRDFDLTNSSIIWPASITSLVVSAFLLTFGRPIDVRGGLLVYTVGIAWSALWTLLAALSRNSWLLTVSRAMQGLGAAAHLPAGLAMLGTSYTPGTRKNLIFSIYGAMAPLGSFLEIVTASVVSRYAHWSWYFWIGGAFAFLALVGSYVTRPSMKTIPRADGVRMDWLGTLTLAATAILSVFTITEAPIAEHGWRSPSIIATGTSAIVALAITIYVEGWVAEQPLVPYSIFRIKYIRPLLIGLLLSYAAVSLYSY